MNFKKINRKWSRNIISNGERITPEGKNHNGKYQVQVLKFEILFCSMKRTCHFQKKNSKVFVFGVQIKSGRFWGPIQKWTFLEWTKSDGPPGSRWPCDLLDALLDEQTKSGRSGKMVRIRNGRSSEIAPSYDSNLSGRNKRER